MNDKTSPPAIRFAREDDLPELEHIVRAAFSTQLGLPTPEAFGDRMMVGPRWRSDPQSVLVAELDGRVVGSNVSTVWGSYGWFGPLSVHPDVWNRGVAHALLAPTMERFAELGTTTQALFTFSSSPKHVGLYQRYGFWPRRLTAILARAPDAAKAPPAYERFSALDAAARAGALDAIRALTHRILDGLDVGAEAELVAAQAIGETLLLSDPDGSLRAFAVVHNGAGSGAGSKDASVKFGAAVEGPAFDELLDALLAYGAAAGVARVVIGINTAREPAYRAALARGFAIAMLGVTMIRGGEGYDEPAAWVIDDHR